MHERRRFPLNNNKFKIGVTTVVLLVALRLALGCHFLYEGVWKYTHPAQFAAETEGFLSATISRGIESPSTFILDVEWTSVEAHTEGFRGSERFAQWKALTHHFYDPFPVVEHFAPVADA